MGIRIHQLLPHVANQIAAGEVIERPASVVKELLENAYDAQASAITIDIGFGGLNHIKISDNGMGIVAEDLPLAVAAHATSKITSLNDLYTIDSMGFRGEALASMASISQLSLSSRPKEQAHAAMLQVISGALTILPCARAEGTTVEVIDLFYNAPVRKRFLKGEKLEFQAIETVVKRFALSAPHIAITLKHNDVLVFSLPAADNESRVAARLTKIFGSSFVKEAIYLDVTRSGMRLHGWISGSGLQRSQNDRQWVYMNQRMVKDKLIHHALKQAYDGILHPGRFPSCLLYFTLPQAEVDVNVHPTKHEVRFQQPRLVHDFFTSQLTAALSTIKAHTQQEIVYREAYQAAIPPLQLSEPHHPNIKTGHTKGHWMMLHPHFGVVLLQKQPLLVQVFRLYSYWLSQQLKQSRLPLAERPLLVPVSYVFPKTWSQQQIDAVRRCLHQFGIVWDEYACIRTIPVQMPYLDVHQFMASLSSCDVLDATTISELLCCAQVFDWHSISLEEREALEEVLTHEAETLYSLRICRPLSDETCRMIVNA